MTKIKITSEQYKSILLREQENRLNASGNVLNENLELGPELLEEGWKEVLLGVASLLGVGLTGLNKAMAQDALGDENIMGEIKSALENKNKIEELVKALEEKGMKNPKNLLAKNAKKIKDEYNKISKDNNMKHIIGTNVIANLIGLDKELAKEYEDKKN